jgi:translation initiation factor 2B subunit (eIF-2B alpha/beta/delta family)
MDTHSTIKENNSIIMVEVFIIVEKQSTSKEMLSIIVKKASKIKVEVLIGHSFPRNYGHCFHNYGKSYHNYGNESIIMENTCIIMENYGNKFHTYGKQFHNYGKSI